MKEEINRRTHLIKSLVKTLGNKSNDSLSDESGTDEPLKGGPKTSEPAPPPQKNTSLSEIDISPHLTMDQSSSLKEVIEKNKDALEEETES